MNLKQYKFHLIILFIVLNSLALFAQEKVIVDYEILENRILINYTIEADSANQYNVKVFLRRSSIPSFKYAPGDVSGSVGIGKFAGGTNVIIWNVNESEMEMFDGDDFYFEVIANRIEKKGGSIPWYYYAGAGVAAGVAALLLGGGSGDGGTTTQSSSGIPNPPNRPIGNN